MPVMENKQPKVLFQYRSSEDPRMLENLHQRVLYLSPSSEFKDPYDCRTPPYMGGDLTDEEYRDMQREYSSRENAQGTSKEEFVRDFNNDEPYIWEAMRAMRGVACFSACNNNLLMWSHYANGGKGFCLAFDTQEQDFFADEWTFPVVYSPTLPKVNMVDVWRGDESAYRRLLAYKSEDWEYEREWRLIGKAKTKIEYAAKTLKAVYLGTEADDKTERKIRAIVKEKYPYTKIKRAYLSKRKYRVLFKPLR